MNPTQQEVHDVFDELYQSLTQAYWVASTITDKDRIRGAADAVFDIVTGLNQADIKSRTQDYATLTDQVNVVTKKFTTLQNDIDSSTSHTCVQYVPISHPQKKGKITCN
jgi:hypothetical protein